LYAFDSIYSAIQKTEAVVVPRNAIAPRLVVMTVALDPIIRTVVATVTGEMRTEEDTVFVVAITTIARTVAAEKDVVIFEVAAIMDEVQSESPRWWRRKAWRWQRRTWISWWRERALLMNSV
jgi:hypothetical protein